MCLLHEKKCFCDPISGAFMKSRSRHNFQGRHIYFLFKACMSTMLFIRNFVTLLCFLAAPLLTATEKIQEELDEEETRTVNTYASRSDPAHRAQIVTGTFRFRRVLNGDSSAQSAQGTGSGWDIEGCYCAAGTRCSCSGNRHRVKMFVRTGSRGSAGSGTRGTSGIPLPPISETGDNELQGTERERERLRIPASQTDGCFCNGNGCSGSTCGSLNGCVCNSSGTCWGAACSARVPVPPAPQLTQVPSAQIVTSPQTILTSSPGVQQVLASLNPLNAVRNALMAPASMTNGQQVMQLAPVSGNLVTQTQPNDCTCNQNGCFGNGCSTLNGCFCVGQNCWGNACQNSVFNQQLQQPMQQQQSGNFIDIPDLFGGGGEAGGGGDIDGQLIPVVQGMPVKLLKGQRARRIRNGGKGRRVVGAMAASGRIRTRARPQQFLKKRSRIPVHSEKRDDDWVPEPVFKPVTINGVPNFVRFSRRKDNPYPNEQTDYVNMTSQSSDETSLAPDAEAPERTANDYSDSFPDKTDVGYHNMKSEESQRRESIYNDPLLFSEDVLNVNFLSLDDR